MKRPLLLVSFVLILGAMTLVFAQETTCPALVQRALTTVGDACAGLGRNQVCYGNDRVTATSATQTALTGFEAPGDRARIGDLSDLATAPLNSQAHIWGVALLSLQANLPDTLPGQNVLVVMFGDVELHSEVQPGTAPAITLRATTKSSANIRMGPGKNYAVVGSLTAGQAVIVIGRNQAGDWLRLDYGTGEGWVAATLVTVEGDSSALAVMKPEQAAAKYTAPMQAFRLKSGVGEPACAEAPRDGILIQTPQHMTVNFLINGIEVQMGSTVLLSAPTDRQLTVSTLEGSVAVTSGGKTQTVAPWSAVNVTEGQPPGAPQPVALADVQPLPVRLLPQQVAVPQVRPVVSPATPNPGNHPTPETTQEPTSPPPPAGNSAVVTVPGNAEWLPSGGGLHTGQVITIHASGQINVWSGCPTECKGDECAICPTQFGGPDGTLRGDHTPADPSDVMVPDARWGALIGRIGKSNAPFLIGSQKTFIAYADGMLYLKINDWWMADNTGAFTVAIDVQG